MISTVFSDLTLLPVAGLHLPRWFEAGGSWPTAVAALVVGVLAAYIAWQQHKVAVEQRRVAYAKFRFDLFERRYEIFESTWIMLSAMNVINPNINELESTFNNARPRAQFLFGVEVEQYMLEVTIRIMETKALRKALLLRGSPESAEQNARLVANESFFQREAGSGARDRFGPYLDFSEWR